uniref:Uncharacterized protein n=1 Tax=Strix occidentalis caurina TaxID=311401 RepID=A0A8D0FA91_STROC
QARSSHWHFRLRLRWQLQRSWVQLRQRRSLSRSQLRLSLWSWLQLQLLFFLFLLSSWDYRHMPPRPASICSSWHPDCQCWAGCSKGVSPLHTIQPMPCGVNGLH